MTSTLNVPVGHSAREHQKTSADRAQTTPPTIGVAVHISDSSAGQTSTSSHILSGTYDPVAAGGSNSPEGHLQRAALTMPALGGNDHPAPIHLATPKRQAARGQTSSSSHPDTVTHCAGAAAGSTSPAASQQSSPKDGSPQGIKPPTTIAAAMPLLHTSSVQTPPPSQALVDTQRCGAGRGAILRDALLAIMADAVDDLERTRIASENRYRQLTRTEADSDGEERGFGLSESVPEVLRVRQVVDGLAALEHQAILTMNRQVRKHPLWKTWAINEKGVGEKQFARLLAAVGDPYWNDLHDRPRTVSELWAYTGYSVAGGVAPKRVKGQKVNWNTNARMRVWNITGSCLKAQGHYSEVYYAAREKYDGALHSADCVRCGPAGKPALAGSPLSGAHQHARALRAIGKELLRDMWLAARALHEQETGQ